MSQAIPPLTDQTTCPTIATSNKPASTPLVWLVSFLLFPYGPFIYLAWLKAISKLQLLVFLVASSIIHFGIVSVLIQTNGATWQPWLVLLLGAANYCLGMLQFTAGEQHRIWNALGQRLWRIFGWFTGVLLLLALLAMVLEFHFSSLLK